MKLSLLFFIACSFIFLSCSNSSSTSTLSSSATYKYFLYTSNSFDNIVSGYEVNAATGSLTVGTTQPSDLGPRGLAATPNGKHVYVAASTGGTVSHFSVNASTGALSFVASYAAGTDPRAVAISPNGSFLYVANNGSNDVSAYSIAASGVLTLIETKAVGNGPQALIVSPTNSNLFVANSTDATISRFSINSATGALTSLGAATAIAGQAFPRGLAISVAGNYLYSANGGSDSISRFDISAGLLSNQVDWATCDGPHDLTFNSTETFAFIPCEGIFSGEVATHTVTNGALSAVVDTETTGITVGSYASVVAPDGTTLYATDGGDSFSVGPALNKYTIGNDSSLTFVSSESSTAPSSAFVDAILVRVQQ